MIWSTPREVVPDVVHGPPVQLVVSSCPCSAHQVTMLHPNIFMFLQPSQLAIYGQKNQEGRIHQLSPPPLKEGMLHVLLACQAQNRTTTPSKSRNGSYTLRLIGTATAMQSVNAILRLERKMLTNLVNILK